MAERLLYRIALFAERRYRGLFLATALLVVVALTLTAQIRFDPDVLSLLPDDDPVVDAFREALNEFGGLNLLLVVVRVPEGAAVDPYEAYASRLGAALERLPELEYVDYRLPQPRDLVRTFYPDAPFFLDAEGRAAVEARLSDEGIARRVAELRGQLTTPQALMRKELMLLDPLGLADVVLARLGPGRSTLGIDWSSGYYLSQDRRRILLLAKPSRPAQDLVFTRRLVPHVEAVIQGSLAGWGERGEGEEATDEPPPPVPEVVLGGGYVVTLDDTALIRRDVVRQAVGSLVIVLALFLFAFRRVGLLVYALVPLGSGLILTFGFAGATGETLSSTTSGFAALLIGLGIDFVIVSYGRYVEERHRGRDASTALRKMTGSCGRAVVVGAVTTAATFYAFAATRFTGLQQMGVMTGTGILFCMLAVLFLLPALLAWSEARHQRRQSEPHLYVHGFGAGWLVERSVRRPGLTLALGGLLTAVAAIGLVGLRFDDAIRNMRAPGNRGVQVEKEVSEHYGSNFEYMMLVLRGRELAAVLEATDRAAEKLRPLVDGENLTSVESIADLLPPRPQQEAVRSWLETGQAGPLDPRRIGERFVAAARAAGLNPAPFAEGLDLLARALAPKPPIELAHLEEDPTTSRLVERYLRETPDGWKSVVYLYTPPTRWKREPPPAVEEVAAEIGGAVLTGVNVVSRDLRKLVWSDAILAALVGTLAVALILWLDYRRLRDALLSLVPLAVGIVWMLGAMVAFGIPMNFMNVFVTTMIIGVGVDYGVHMLHRYREMDADEPEALAEGLAETGRAIGMAAVTTMVGFGSLVLSAYPGLRSIGFVSILGALGTSGAAITLLPAFLTLRARRAVARSSPAGGALPPG